MSDNSHYNHAVIKVPTFESRNAALEVLVYQVGPPVNWTFLHTRREMKLVLWGENLDQETLQTLGDSCHELEQDHSDMGLYEAAQGADQMESEFIFNNYQKKYE